MNQLHVTMTDSDAFPWNTVSLYPKALSCKLTDTVTLSFYPETAKYNLPWNSCFTIKQLFFTLIRGGEISVISTSPLG